MIVLGIASHYASRIRGEGDVENAKKKAKREAELAKAMENPPIIHKFKIGDIVRCKEDPIAREVFAIQPDGYRIVGGFIPFEEADKWYHCYEQFKNYW